MSTDKADPISSATLQASAAAMPAVDEEYGLKQAVGVASSFATDDAVLPLYAEQIAVAHRKLERNVQVHVRTVSREHPVDELLTHERVEIERVAIGREIDAIPADRQEGDTTIIPVVEEVVVIRRQLVLKEEIRMRRVRVMEHHRETVTLREQEVTVERSELAASAAPDTSTPTQDFAS